ncbi:MAG TPA: PP2C family protein-serine/threonine phosphatase [Acidobacteriota bacterium]|nr:PP2C family protein-serine/threonine phosphatase [Acidobacteriota bacterium]
MGSGGQGRSDGTWGREKWAKIYSAYTEGLSSEEVERLFRHETRDAWRFFTSEKEREDLKDKSWDERLWRGTKALFVGFILKLSPVRRVIYTVAALFFVLGMVLLVRDTGSPGFYLLASFLLFNLLLGLELADKLMLKSDLMIARRIQFTLLPPEKYRREGVVDVYGASIPANTVGGDYYDVLEIEDGKLLLAIGDVSGKGIPAALLMAYLQASLRALIADGRTDLVELMSTLNRHIFLNTPSNKLITFFLAKLDFEQGRLWYCNAGHNRPLLLKRDGQLEELSEGGLPLGIREEQPYQQGELGVKPGDLLYGYTDGVTEAERESGEQFEEERLRQALRRYAGQDPEAICRMILKEVRDFVKGNRFRDDLTMLIARLENKADASQAGPPPPPPDPPS